MTSLASSAPAAAGPLLTIDLDAVAANTRFFAARSSGELMAVVKADGYGHGAIAVAEVALANGATRLGVTSVDEALALRRAGITAPILSWLNHPAAAGFAPAVAAGIDLAAPSLEHLRAIVAATAGGRGAAERDGAPGFGNAAAFTSDASATPAASDASATSAASGASGTSARSGASGPSAAFPLPGPDARGVARVHLHLDTGMARDGAEPTGWIELCREAKQAELDGRIRVVGLMGHLSDGDDPGAPSNRLGRALFEWGLDVARLTGLDPRLQHLAATSATLTMPGSHFTACRVGAGLVGIDLSRTARLAAPLSLTAPLLLVRKVAVGTAVGYGHDWVAPRSTRLGLIGLGYADGLPRGAAGRAEVLVRGRRHPVVGRMSMDQAVIDLGDSGAEVGESVTVFGPGDAGEPTVAEWAEWADTIEHEIVTRVGSRVRRRTVGGSRRGTALELQLASEATSPRSERVPGTHQSEPATAPTREQPTTPGVRRATGVVA